MVRFRLNSDLFNNAVPLSGGQNQALGMGDLICILHFYPFLDY